VANTKMTSTRRDALADFGGGVDQIFGAPLPEGVTDLARARSISIDLLEANPYQPRKTFDEAALVELTDDIEEHGVLQPLLVRPHPQERGRYQIAAGERRWRAARLAGLAQVPCIERDMDDGAMERLALTENIQRADLDPVDEAHAYKRLIDRLGLSMRDVAASVHKDHSYVAGRLLLIKYSDLEEQVRVGAIGPTVATGIARIADDERRDELIGRVKRGEHIGVDDVKGMRSSKQATVVPEPPPAAETAPPATTPKVGNIPHDEPEDALDAPLVPTTGDAAMREPYSAGSVAARGRQERTTKDRQAEERALVVTAVRSRSWPMWETVLEYGVEGNMTVKTLLRLCREAERAEEPSGDTL